MLKIFLIFCQNKNRQQSRNMKKYKWIFINLVSVIVLAFSNIQVKLSWLRLRNSTFVFYYTLNISVLTQTNITFVCCQKHFSIVPVAIFKTTSIRRPFCCFSLIVSTFDWASGTCNYSVSTTTKFRCNRCNSFSIDIWLLNVIFILWVLIKRKI